MCVSQKGELFWVYRDPGWIVRRTRRVFVPPPPPFRPQERTRPR